MEAIRAFLTAGRALSRDALSIFSSRGARLLSASIAFYALLSVVPMLVIAIEIAGAFVDPAVAGSAATAELARSSGLRAPEP